MAKTKLLVSGLPNCGKTTLLQSLTDVLVIARDGKRYPFKQAHINVPDFESADELIGYITEAVNKYEEKLGKLPETIVIDSLSKIILDIEGNILATVKSFPYGVINTEIKKIVDFIERDLADAFNVVITSHAIYNEDTLSYSLVNAGGSWGKKGGILSEVDQAIFIEIKGKNRIVHFRHPKLAARTTDAELPDNIPMEEFNLQSHLDRLNSLQDEAKEWELNLNLN